jgi:hypothetical protein
MTKFVKTFGTIFLIIMTIMTISILINKNNPNSNQNSYERLHCKPTTYHLQSNQKLNLTTFIGDASCIIYSYSSPHNYYSLTLFKNDGIIWKNKKTTATRKEMFYANGETLQVHNLMNHNINVTYCIEILP